MKKHVLVCDSCGTQIENGNGGWLRANYHDSRRSSKLADLCDECMAALPGQPVARRGRKPKETT